MKVVLLYSKRANCQYEMDWRDAFINKKNITVIDFPLNEFSIKKILEIKNADLIILLHAYGITYDILDKVQKSIIKRQLKNRKGKLVIFEYNEYKYFNERRKRIVDLNIDFVASQLTKETADYLYGDLTKVISMPHALNPGLYKSKRNFKEKKIMIGSRTSEYPSFLLDNTRNNLLSVVNYIRSKKGNWKIDYDTDLQNRMPREQWVTFLSDCKFTISTEAGAAYVDKTDDFQNRIIQYIKANKNATPKEIESKFAKEALQFPTGKCISPRHFEAIGCRTCQVLVEGYYSGILYPNEHYIMLKKNFSNIEEVLEKMEDEKLVLEIVDNSFTHIINKHTHCHRITELFKQIQL